MKLSEIKPNPNNPRLIKDDRFKGLVKSIEEFPKMMSLRPIIVDNNMVILGGNMRYKALQELKFKDIPDEWVKKASELTEEEMRRFIIADNIQHGDWNIDILNTEWDNQEMLDWGLEIPEFKKQFSIEEDNYEIPDEIETDIKLGDIFLIGEHRLMCGDSTKKEDVGRLLNEDKPNLMITDPPYGVSYNANWRNEADRANGKKLGASALGKVNNDDISSWVDAYSLFPGNVCYVWHASASAIQFAIDLMDSGFEIRNQIIWAKNNIVISRGHYHWKHEPCWYAVRKGQKSDWIGDRSQSTVWNIDKPLKSETGHSTQKPIECMGKPLHNHNGDVYDPFIGSGTTMAAAQQLGRICYGMEIDPKYCQVIIDRMKNLDPEIKITNG